jgi:hypothetical protein
MDTLIIFLFGFIDNAVIVIFYFYSAISIDHLLNKHLKLRVNAFILPVIVCTLANSISDNLGFLLQGQVYYAFIVFLGCIIGMITIPIMQYFKKNQVK